MAGRTVYGPSGTIGEASRWAGWVGLLVVLALVGSTVWFWASASQARSQLDRTRTALAQTQAHAESIQKTLDVVEGRVLRQRKVLVACRAALTRSVAASTLTSKASVLETKGGAARSIAASNVLGRAMDTFKSGLNDLSVCRG